MLALVLVVAYLVGAIPFAVPVGRVLAGVDVRHTGSGNTGAMNTLRSAGPLAGILVALLDASKGVLAVFVTRRLLGVEAGALAGCAAVIGHCFSPYMIAASRHAFGDDWKRTLRATGGKGLATGIGALLAIGWATAAAAAIVFAIVFAVQRKDVTWPSVLGALAAVPAISFTTRNVTLTIAVFLVAFVVAVKHLPDLREGFWVESES